MFKSSVNKGCIVIILLIFIVSLSWINSEFKLLTVNRKFHSCTSDVISVMTFNVNALDTSTFTEQRQLEFLELIKAEYPDILCLQELSTVCYDKVKVRLDCIYGHPDFSCLSGTLNNFRLYSRFPMRNLQDYQCQGEIKTDDMDSLSLVDYRNRFIVMPLRSAEFEVAPGRWVTVFSGHLRSSAYSTSRRSMDKGTSWLGGVPLYWRNYKIGKRIRDFEARNVRGFIDDARSAGMPVIVAGDLNDWCGSDCLETLMGNDLKDAWWEGGRGFGWTYFGWHLRLRIDHILYSDELQLTDVRVVDSDLSDHKPLKATFSWKEQNND